MAGTRFNQNNFDLIRLLAAAQVMVTHGATYFHLDLPGLRFLDMFPGVPIFFVISGFLVSASWERSPALGAYLKNRFLRIYPGLWVCLAFSLFVLALYHPAVSAGEFAVWILAQATFVQVYSPESLRGFGAGVLNGSLWTIPVELQFYLLLPFLYGAFGRLKWNRVAVGSLLGALFAAHLCFSLFAADIPSSKLRFLIAASFLPHLFLFFVGVVLQRNPWFVDRYLAGRALPLALVYFVVYFASRSQFNTVCAAVLAMLAISCGYTGQKALGGILGGNDISYGVYIYHVVWINALLLLSPFRAAAANMAAMIALTMLSAILSWRLVEKPALGLKRYSIFRRAQPGPVGDAP